MTWAVLLVWSVACLLSGAAAALAYGRATSGNQFGGGEPDRNEFTFWWERDET